MDKALRHELHRDEIGDALKEARGFLTNADVMKPALAVAGLFVVLLGLYYGQKFRVSAAESAFSRATEVFHGPVGASAAGATAPGGAEKFATAAEKFQKAKTMFDEVASSYGSMPAGRRARYYSAMCLAELGQFAQAEEALKPIAALRDSTIIEPAMARLRLAEIALRAGRAKDAAKSYETLIADDASGLAKDVLLFGLGESLEAAGEKAQALRAYTDLVNRHPQSPFVQEARKKMDELAIL